MKYWYLATPYSKYPKGIHAAFNLACREHGRLVAAGVPVFCPIAHTHATAMISGIDPLDHKIWTPVDEPFMHGAHGLIMLTAESWEQSYGMKVEREAFEAAGKPIVWMEPGKVPNGVL